VTAVKDAAWWRAYRARKGARTGAHGPAPTAACPSRGAWSRHKRTGDTCQCPEACRAAYNAYQVAYNRGSSAVAAR
jgi:hypothetical protein